MRVRESSLSASARGLNNLIILYVTVKRSLGRTVCLLASHLSNLLMLANVTTSLALQLGARALVLNTTSTVYV